MKLKQKILCVLLWILGIFCIGYFIMLMVTIGPSFRFNYVWLLAGLFFIAVVLTITYSKKGFYWMPKPMVIAVEIIVFLGLFLFVVIEGLIIKQGVTKPQMEADYLIVLGAKVNGKNPSHILNQRIQAAFEYLEAHSDCKVIVSGGKGPDEGISEALAMKEGLVKRGISEDRIILEDQSVNTKENLEFSKKILEKEGTDLSKVHIIVVTTDFHVFRAVGIAKKTGYQHVEGLASKQIWYLIPTNYVREFLAVIKDFLVGNM